MSQVPGCRLQSFSAHSGSFLQNGARVSWIIILGNMFKNNSHIVISDPARRAAASRCYHLLLRWQTLTRETAGRNIALTGHNFEYLLYSLSFRINMFFWNWKTSEITTKCNDALSPGGSSWARTASPSPPTTVTSWTKATIGRHDIRIRWM